MWGLLLLGSLLLVGCGGGSAVSNSGGNFADMNFGDLSVRAASTNPPVTSNGGGVTVTGLTGQITRMQLYSNSFALAGKIVFASSRDGSFEIYSMNPDGSSQTRLTNNPAEDREPFLSPDGTKIVFASNRDGSFEIYSMNIDGSNQTRLTSNANNDYAPKWSPDGARIAFTSDRDGGTEIYSMNVDGSNQTRLTNDNSNSSSSWSPDSSKIAFSSNHTLNNEIWVMNADGSNKIPLTSNSANNVGSSWSPDGTQITFISNKDTQNNIYTMNPDGTHLIRLTSTAAYDAPSWSPDGSKMTFSSQRDGHWEIYVMDPDGSHQVRLTSNPANSYISCWGKTSPTRTLVGSGGEMAGSSSGFLVGTGGGVSKSVFTFSVPDFTAISMKTLSGLNNTGDRLDFSIEGGTAAVNFNKSGVAYLNLDEAKVVKPFTSYSGNLNGLLVSFGAQISQGNAGKVFLVIPYTAPNRSAGRPSIQLENGIKVYRGTFPAAFDGKGKNIAPNGATEIRVNEKTGAVLSVR